MPAFLAPAPWTARKMENYLDGWEVVACSMVDGAPSKGAPVATHLSEADAKLIASAHSMRAVLDRIKAWADEQSDVRDGNHGFEPNDAMRIQGEIEQAGL